MAGNGRKNADALALALAAGDSVPEAAVKAGMGERTAYRRLADPAFRQRIQALRGEMIGQALGRMANGMTEAADVLRALLKADAETVRLGAARSLLDLGVKLRESVELQDKVKQLESILEQVSASCGRAAIQPVRNVTEPRFLGILIVSRGLRWPVLLWCPGARK
jgi:hypothetical protein